MSNSAGAMGAVNPDGSINWGSTLQKASGAVLSAAQMLGNNLGYAQVMVGIAGVYYSRTSISDSLSKGQGVKTSFSMTVGSDGFTFGVGGQP